MRKAAVDVSRDKKSGAGWDLGAKPIKYSVSLKDPPRNRNCHIYVCTDWDLELLLFFLRSVPGLEYDVRDLRVENFDP